MSNPVLLQDKFHGMHRDSSRSDIPSNKAYDLVNVIPDELGAPLRKRGGYTWHGSATDTIDASSGSLERVIVAPFAGGTQVLALDNRTRPELFDITNSADRGDLYAADSLGPYGQPVFYREMVIFATSSNTNSTAPRKYVAAGTISDLGGSPPDFMHPCVYKDRLVVAEWAGETIYFSAAGNAESWDTTNRFMPTSDIIRGFAPMKNSLLVFHSGSVERIRGSIPPGSAAANMELEPLFSDVGVHLTSEGQSCLWVTDEYVYWADENGVYRSDGTGLTDLTKQAGISTYWRSAISGCDATIAVWRGFIWISLLDPSDDSYSDFLVYDINRRYWFRFENNIRAKGFALQSGATDELYFAHPDSNNQVSEMSGVFDPDTNVEDADGGDISVTIKTRYYDLDSMYLKRWRHLYAKYVLIDNDNSPTLAVTLKDEKSATVGIQTIDPFPENSDNPTQRLRVRAGGKMRQGMAFDLAVALSSGDFRLYALEADVTMMEGSRRRATG